MSGSDQVERELKLGAWPEFELPELAGALDGVTAGAATQRELDATYYDTSDLHLLRRGATLRFRRGEPPGDVWTAKLPSDGAAEGLARREITVGGRRDALPGEFADLTRGWALAGRLRPIARVRTRRVSLPLCNGDGRVLATLDDDAVTVMRGRRVVARFRELEVELVGDAPAELIPAVDERLRAAGAEKVPQIPKLSRALGRAAAMPWQLAPPELGSKPTMAAAAHARVSQLVAELVDLHASLVLDAGDSARHARDVVRRLRAVLAHVAPMVDPPPPPSVGLALAWVDGELGRVTDVEALLDVVQQARDAVVVPAPSGRALVSRAAGARERARARLLRSLRDRRYTEVLQRLEQLVSQPPSASTAGARRVGSAARKHVRAAWRPLRDAAPAEPGALGTIVVSLVASLELACSVPNADASAALEQVGRLRALGLEHDTAHTVATRLRSLVRGGREAETWAAGVIAGIELAHAQAAAAQFEELRARLAQKPAWSWTE